MEHLISIVANRLSKKMVTAKKKPVAKKVEESCGSLADLLGMDNYVAPEEIVEEKAKKLSPFDFIGAVTYSKEQLIVDDTTEKQYIPFIVNRGLSNSIDTIIYANEMNARPHISKAGQFAFLLKTIPKRKRFDKWAKAEEVADIELVKEYYQCSNKKAVTALSILTGDQIDYIRKKLHKGG
jgi:hypothetical protein